MSRLDRYGGACRCLLRLRQQAGQPALSEDAFIEAYLHRFPAWKERPGDLDAGGLLTLAAYLGVARHTDVVRSYHHVLAHHRAGNAVIVLTERAPQQGTEDDRMLRYTLLLEEMNEHDFSVWCPYPTGLDETFSRVSRQHWDDWRALAIILEAPLTAAHVAPLSEGRVREDDLEDNPDRSRLPSAPTLERREHRELGAFRASRNSVRLSTR